VIGTGSKPRHVSCPMCGRTFAPNLVDSHAFRCAGSSGVVGDCKESQTARMDSTVQKRRKVGESGKNAMQLLMKAAASFEVFVLEQNGVCAWMDQDSFKGSGAWKCEIKLDGKPVRVVSREPSSFDSPEHVVSKLCSAMPQLGASFAKETWLKGKRASQLTPGVLKSLLQKSVRRKLSGGAIFCAIELLLSNEVDALLRRLPVIMLEDVQLLEDFDRLVFLMVAVSKGFKLHERHVTFVLEAVIRLCEHTKTDSVPENPILSGFPDNLASSKQFCLLKSMEIRASFGGLKCDVLMIRRFHNEWLQRFKRGTKLSDTTAPEINDFSSLEFVLPIAGLDFHVAPWMISILASKCDSRFSENDIRSSMWRNFSSINARDQNKLDSSDEIWDLVGSEAKKISESWLRRRIPSTVKLG